MEFGQSALEDVGVNAIFWQGKRVLITGHTGFKGSWLSLWLQAQDAVVAGFALPPPTQNNLFDIAGVGNGMASTIGDIRNLVALRRCVEDFRPDIVFHMAAQALVRPSYADPVETYATNVLGTVHLLEAVRGQSGVRTVINVTSDKCYDNKELPIPYRESDPMGGLDPYSSSKGCAELVTSAYAASFFKGGATSLASVRAGNVIGGGDWAPERLVPDFMRAVSQGEELVIRNPDAVRPWQHVLEPLSGYLKLAERLWDNPNLAGGWNFGPDHTDAWQVQRLAQELITLWGNGASCRINRTQQPHEAHYLTIDSAKARTQLDWRPRWSIDRSLKAVVEWHHALQRGEAMKDVTLAQIRQYELSA